MHVQEMPYNAEHSDSATNQAGSKKQFNEPSESCEASFSQRCVLVFVTRKSEVLVIKTVWATQKQSHIINERRTFTFKTYSYR